MKTSRLNFLLFFAALLTADPLFGATATVLGWNNLGMHCMDSDYSVFSILPPYNTIEAQLIVNGGLITSAQGYSVTYQAIADPDGSINTTAIGKGNFFTYTPYMYGSLPLDMGLAGWAMPGTNNVPQSMRFETTNNPAVGVTTPVNWFRAEGIPISPFDDSMQRNEYPLMRLTARDPAGVVLATSDIVLPVSDEMDCRSCHASGTQAAAQPAAGWVFNANPERDYRLNILRLHDEIEFQAHQQTYVSALATRGLNPSGLYANVATDGRPIYCATCHTSEALQGSGLAGIPPLTQSIHSLHAGVTDPVLHIKLDDSANRASCYRCHPGSTAKCLRGAMGTAVAADGSMEMQCQSCHGNLSQVGASTRVGWFMEPSCQNCHSGTATQNSGQIRFTSVFTTNGTVRVAANQTFATTPNTPAAGLSLYRFSVGHGGLQCSACHGSTHAEFTSAFRNDNIESMELQGHVGMIAECTACHVTMPATVSGGPHGLHPMGATWVSQHQNAAEGNRAQCQTCHGTDYRGTVLSVMKADRTINGQSVFRGAIIGCYMCHNGPGGDGNPGPAPTVSNVTANTVQGKPVSILLASTGTNVALRIISQASLGSVGLSNNVATYFPDPTFTGVDTFTFAAYNGSKNSNLGTGTVVIATSPGSVPPTITTQPLSQTVAVGTSVTFTVGATGTLLLNYQWQRNGVNISGATGAALTLPNVTSTSAGSYRVIVNNTVGSVTSSAATLTVSSAVAPTITTQPVSQTVAVGATVSFTVVATGTTPLSYQWQKNGVNISGATSATLTLTSVTSTSAGSYRVIVSNTVGSVTSSAATLTVSSAVAPTIATQPVSQTVAVGATVTFTVVSTGATPLSYQWQKNGVNISGATSATLTLTSVTSTSAGSYRVIVRNTAGAATSTSATLTVNSPPLAIVLTSPTNGGIFDQEDSIRITATVTPSGSARSVRYFDGSKLIGSDNEAPFTIRVRLSPGIHILTAQAISLTGAVQTSAPVQITVTR